MKQSAKIALGGLIAAFSVLLMFMTGLFPFATFALPAAAGILLACLVIECGYKWAFTVYAAVSLLAFFMTPDREAAILFVFFFGHYPIEKGLIERIKLKPACWAIKMAVFNVCIVSGYLVLSYLFGLNEFIAEFAEYGQYGLLIFWAVGNVVFVIYDIAITQLITAYYSSLRPKISRLFK